jgi:Rrf2 family nitric oxide-sensitive transcriptional repressor
MITREADYAIRSLILLAIYEREKSLLTTAILSKKMDIPYRFLRKIMIKLRDCGFIETKKGKMGGLKLKKSEKEISIMDVLNAFSSYSVSLNRCTVDETSCERVSYCKFHEKLAEIQDSINKTISSLTLDQII